MAMKGYFRRKGYWCVYLDGEDASLAKDIRKDVQPVKYTRAWLGVALVYDHNDIGGILAKFEIPEMEVHDDVR